MPRPNQQPVHYPAVNIEAPQMIWTQDDSLYERFTLWRQQCKLILDSDLVAYDDARKRSYVLRWAGTSGLSIYNSWQIENTPEDNLQTIWTKFEDYCKPQANSMRSRHELWHHTKQNQMSVEEYYAIILNKSKVCFPQPTFSEEARRELTRDAFIFGLKDENMMHKFIAENTTLENAKTKMKLLESAKQTVSSFRPKEVHQLRHNRTRVSNNKRSKRKNNDSQHHNRDNKRVKFDKSHNDNKHSKVRNNFYNDQNCFKCGFKKHTTTNADCPAKNKRCNTCKKVGHFTSRCYRNRKMSIQQIVAKYGPDPEVNDESDLSDLGESSEASDSYIGLIHASNTCANIHETVSNNHQFLVTLNVTAVKHHKHKSRLPAKIDTGADVCIMSKQTYVKLTRDKHCKYLKSPQCTLKSYGGHSINNLGTTRVFIHKGKHQHPVIFNVSDTEDGSTLLSGATAKSLGLISVNIEQVHHQTTTLPADGRIVTSLDQLKQQYSDLLDEKSVGTFKCDPYVIQLDPDVIPKKTAPRPVAAPLQELFRAELQSMLDLGVIVEVHQPTPWINSFVIVESKNKTTNKIEKIRICLDPTNLNKACEREPYYYRTLEDVLPNLANARVFTVIDLKRGYWHVPLSEESSMLTTFNTPYGRYRFTRMPFGINVAGDAFIRNLDAVLSGLENVTGIADDVYVYAENDEQHDRALTNVLNRLREHGIRIGSNKIQYKLNTVNFYGITCTSDGHKPQDNKIAAIVNMKTPENVKQLQSFLGMAQYLNTYSPVLADLCAPLYKLTRDNVPFQWGHEHSEAFELIKQELSKQPVLQYYDVKKEVTLQVDASNTGLGLVLLQDNHPILYASRALRDHETRYVALEKEALATAWAMERCHHYLYGRFFTLETDHKPLETILSRSIVESSPRLQRIITRTMPYDFKVCYIKGTTNKIADCMSRCMSTTEVGHTINLPKVDVHCITSTLKVKKRQLHELRDATAADQEMQDLQSMIMHGWPDKVAQVPQALRKYYNFREDLTIEDGLVLKRAKILVPESKRKELITKIHYPAHLGLEKSLLRAKSTLYWPGLYKDIEAAIANCETCLTHCRASPKSHHQRMPVGPEIPNGPWIKIGTDLFEFGRADYLLVVDYYSRFPIIRRIENKTSNCVTKHMKSILYEHGIVETIVSDNGPCYVGKEFQDLCAELEIDHVHSSPNNPTGNGLAEKYVDIVKQRLTKAKQEGTDPYRSIYVYRTTPLSKKLPSPMELLNGRVHTDLPMSHARKSQMQPTRRMRIQEKSNHESTKKLPSMLNVKDKVVIWNRQDKSWSKKGEVVQALDNYQYKVRTEDGTYYIRTRRHLKSYRPVSEPQAASVNAPKDTTRVEPIPPVQAARSTEQPRRTQRVRKPVSRLIEKSDY